MKKIASIVFALIISIPVFAQKKDVLSGKFSIEQLRNILIPQDKWTPFPKLQNREGWLAADQEMLKSNLKIAETYLNYTWPSIPATKSLLIERTGNRSEYEEIAAEKRKVLGILLLAEIYEDKGRFTDPIINGIWSICEESYWGAPAHFPKTKEYSGLMDVSQPFVELFGAETATYLAWVDYFMGDKLDAVSPQIRKRIYLEVNNRIFQPVMTKPHSWMTTNANGRRPNNWNPWICSNWLNATLLLEKDEKKRVVMVFKILHVLDEFLNPYPQDGGCDEGPGYWGAATACLYDNVSMLNLATNNAFQYVYQDEKFKNMGKFIYRAQISKNYFLNFADADPQPKMAAALIYRFGRDIQDADMMKFGASYRRPKNGELGSSHYFRNLFELFMQDEFQKATQGMPMPKDVWLPDIQVMIARDEQGTSKGLFVAAQGGHNDESHNHNDVGNYVVYYDGLPVLIDVGKGTYTRKTFGSQRYEIWSNSSDYHNTPTINGKVQLPGSEYKAGNIACKKGNGFTELSLDISKAYPTDAGINSWQRTIRLNRGKNVEVNDVISLKKADEVTEHLMTCYPSEVIKPGELIIHYMPNSEKAHNFVIKYNAKQLQPLIEKVKLTAPEDKGIEQKWGDNIYRINFKVITPKTNDKINFVITQL